jgi:hypothetical protein
MFGFSSSFSAGKITYNEPSVAGIIRGSRFEAFPSVPNALIIGLPVSNSHIRLPQGSKPVITPSSVTTRKLGDKLSAPPWPSDRPFGDPEQKTNSSAKQ